MTAEQKWEALKQFIYERRIEVRHKKGKFADRNKETLRLLKKMQELDPAIEIDEIGKEEGEI